MKQLEYDDEGNSLHPDRDDVFAAGIIDSHCHIYPGSIAHKAAGAINSFYEGISDSLQDGTAGTLLRTGKENGITHFIVHSVATKPEQVSSINRFLKSSEESAGGAFTALGTMHPNSASIDRDMDELCDLKLHGVKIHPDIQQFRVDDPKIMRVYELCEELGLPVVVHTGDRRYDYSNPERVAAVLRAFPRLTFVGAHFGGWSVWDDARKLLPDFPNIIVDTSSSFHWLDPKKALEIIRAYGSERVMFGTDYPLWDQGPEIAFLKNLDLTDAEYENILRKTCEKTFGINR
ncbi:MAG: amidohydrolase family protein [Lachnospiraceae bacterium]|nr:amidohydrolase family protein [Lachnospiraceae bacterium]